ncbi:MAG: response regulator transcription factor [Geminicoccaceae bacterium]
MLRDYLTQAGYAVRTAATGSAGLVEAGAAGADAMVLDVMLPDLDGFEVCRRVRRVSTVPVLMLTARGDETDRIVGLELGADDYLPEALQPARAPRARLKAILRRGRGEAGRACASAGSRSIRARAGCGSTARAGTSFQLDLLLALARHPGRVLSRDQLMELVKGTDGEAFDRSIDVHVSRIRAAIEDDPKRPRRILTVRGAGHVFARVQDDEA